MSPAADAVDVLVVGAGPAGSTVAWRLARRGFRVRILDALEFPRSKPCGDAISPGATPLLEEAGVADRLERAGAARIRGWRIRAPGGTWIRGAYRSRETVAPPVGLAAPRAELDALLLAVAVDAGAEFLPLQRVFRLLGLGEEGRATGVLSRGPDGRERRFPARTVVGADGLRSRIARQLGSVRRGRRRRIALVGRFAGGLDVTNGSEPDGRFGELRLGGECMVGLAPIGGGRWNATVVVPARRARTVSGNVIGFYRSRLAAMGVEGRLRRAHLLGPPEVTGPFEVRPARTTAPGVVLTGDAAGYFDPFTGQGVYRALATGRMAAEAVAASLDEPSREAEERRRYAAGLRRFLSSSRRVQWLVDAVAFRPALMNPFARLASWRPGLADLLVDVTGDRLPPGALASPRRLGCALRARPVS